MGQVLKMTEKPIELTDEQISKILEGIRVEEFGVGYRLVSLTATERQMNEFKIVIKTALTEYPKLKEKWDLYVKFSREGFYSFDCEPEDGTIWGGCVKRSKIDQDYKLLYEKINEVIKLKDEIKSMTKTFQVIEIERSKLGVEIGKLKAENEKLKTDRFSQGVEFGNAHVMPESSYQHMKQENNQIKQRIELLKLLGKSLDWGNYPHSDDLLYDIIDFLSGKNDAFYIDPSHVKEWLEKTQFLKDGIK